MAVPVLLGLLASQGARAVATRIAGSSGTIRKVQNVLSKNFQKAQKESLSKGKIPTEKTLTQGLTKDQKGLLSNQGLLSTTPKFIPSAPINQLARTPTASGFGLRTGGEITRTPMRSSNMFPVPVRPTSPLSELNTASRTQSFPFPPPPKPVIERATGAFSSPIVTSAERTAATQQAALDAFKRGQTFGRGRTIPGSQRIMSPLGAITTTGLIGSAATLPMMFGAEQPQPVMANAVGAPQVAQTPQEQEPRFGQVLRPSSESTSKEVINAALLRAGLTLLRGGTGTEALESAASIADAQTTYRTGAQALKAGQEALGKDAQISIYQRSDGTFGYSGTTPKISTTGTSFFNDELGSIPTITTKKEYDDLPSGAQYYTTDSEGNPQLSTKP